MGKPLPRYLGRNSDTWYAPDGTGWEVEMDWADIGGRAECVGVTLRSFLVTDELREAWATKQAPGAVPLVPAVPWDEDQEVRPVRAEVLRRLTRSMIESARQKWVLFHEPPADIHEALTDEQRAELQEGRELFTKGEVRKLAGRDGTPLPPEEALAEVAATYRRAWREGRSPTKAVADELGFSYSAAAKRVRRARDAGLLPETSQGRPTAADDDTKGS